MSKPVNEPTPLFHDLRVVAPLKVEPGEHDPLGEGTIPRPQGRGPIEGLPCLAQPCRAPPLFHDLRVVAPLKALGESKRVSASVGLFHDLRVVAPLKGVLPTRITYISNAIPRPQGRGPIEGLGSRRCLSLQAPIPRPQGRGPIEACRSCSRFLRRRPIPRPQGRGPIEACLARSTKVRHRELFHDLRVVAPLKLAAYFNCDGSVNYSTTSGSWPH